MAGTKGRATGHVAGPKLEGVRRAKDWASAVSPNSQGMGGCLDINLSSDFVRLDGFPERYL